LEPGLAAEVVLEGGFIFPEFAHGRDSPARRPFRVGITVVGVDVAIADLMQENLTPF
jgi:hypothetical protein